MAVSSRLALFLVFMSGIGYSVQSLLIKLLSEHGFHASFQLIFLRGLVQMALTSVMMLYSRLNLPSTAMHNDTAISRPTGLFGGSWKIAGLLWARGLFGFGAIAFAFLSLEYIPLADSITLLMMSPMYAAMLSYIFLGEPWLCVEYASALLSLTGVLLVSRPPALLRLLPASWALTASMQGQGRGDLSPHEQHQVHVGLLCAALAGMCAGCAFCTIRVLGTTSKMPWPNIAFVQGLVQALFALPCMYLAGQHLALDISGQMWIAIVGTALIGSCSQFSMTVGMQHEKSARATLMRMSDILGAFLWQVLFTHDALSSFTVAGALLIALGVLLVVVIKGSGGGGEKDGGGSAISQLMKKVEMQVVAASTRSQKQQYSQLQREEEDGETYGDDDDDDDLEELCMTDGELSLLDMLEKGQETV